MTPLLYVFAIGFCRAVDGDTLRCGTERVRLIRIDAAEMRGPHAEEAHAAKRHLAALIDGSKVYCVTEARDRYGRLLGECSSGRSRSLGNSMLEAGLAEKYGKRVATE